MVLVCLCVSALVYQLRNIVDFYMAFSPLLAFNEVENVDQI